jgi:hypothetical protein
MMVAMQRWTFALAALVLGCDVKTGPPTISQGAALPCRSASDCASGSCLADEGICNAPFGSLDTLLFEITPQATDPEYGSARFYSYQKGLARTSSEQLVLNVAERVPVQGQVDAAPEQDACRREGTSLPVALVFTPRERLLGLSVPSYTLDARFDDGGTNEFRFSGALPAGRYDVYMRPRPPRTLPTGCNLAPQIFRDVPVEPQSSATGASAAPLTPVQRTLRLSMAWKDALEGWTVDMLHPVTGEVISTRSTLQRSRVVDYGQGSVIEFTLHYSLGAKDFIQEGEELVRLTPRPEDSGRKGVVLLQREGLELVTPGEGTIGDVTSFGEPIAFQSWVWPLGDKDRAVAGTVTYAATSLSEFAGGVDASFTGSERIDDLGQIKLALLPGSYRLRVVPAPNEGLSASEFPLLIRGDAPIQQGSVLDVPRAAEVSGRVLATDGDAPLANVEVVLTPSQQPLDNCGSVPTTDPLCVRPRAEVRQRALGEDPFVPRQRRAVTASDGAFSVPEVDCGSCKPGQGAGFDFTLRPSPASGLPWMVKPALRVDADRRLEQPLRIPAPVTRPVLVTFGDASDTNGLPDALVTAYVLLDANSQPINDPENVPPCLGARPEDPVCIQSAVAVAEGRSDFKGELLLLLPPSLE